MNLQKTSVSEHHSLHNHISLDVLNENREEMPDVEGVQTIQLGTLKRHASDTNGSMKHGQDMLLPNATKFSVACFWNSLYLVIVILSSTAMSIPVTLIPLQNAIKFPDYWWEFIIPIAFSSSLYTAINIILECRLIFNLETFKSCVVLLRLYAINLLSVIITVFVCYIIWTVWMGNNHPIPLLGGILYIVLILIQSIAVWFHFPCHLRSLKVIRNQIWAYLFFRLWMRFRSIQVLMLRKIMIMISLQLQWIMAIILPIHREFNLWVVQMLLKKSTDCSTTLPLVPKLTATTVLNIAHAYNITMIISSLATETTTYSILAVDFMINIFI